MNIESKNQYKDFYTESINQTDQYWTKIAEGFSWTKPWNTVTSGDFSNIDMKWFDGGELNITENCLDRHMKSHPDRIAILWEPNNPEDEVRSFTYREVLENVNRFANVLSNKGVVKGDRICFYMSMVPELVFGMLACARVGAVHSVVFGGFSAQALSGRINDCESKVVITCDEGLRGNKKIPLKEITDKACSMSNCVETILVYQRTFKDLSLTSGRDFNLNSLLENASTEFKAVSMKAEDPLFILYTSGSTGQPKGLQHTIAGYMIWASETHKHVFQYKPNDIFWCSADIGWITGHTYITYGPLLNGATQVMFEGIPTYPTPSRFWNIIDKYKVNQFYTAPTAIRALEACDIKYVEEADLSSLQVLGTVGEPINEEAWNWYNDKIGKKNCPIVDTWFQTETGGISISNLAGVTPAIPCHATKPLPGIDLLLVDNNGNEVMGNPAHGNLCIRKPWPGIARTIYGDHQRYIQTYFSTYKNFYFTGDGAKRDEDGNYRITGRVDDVINVSGHRVGTAEIEDVIDEHKGVVEAAITGFPHAIKGQGIMAFIIPSQENQLSEEELIIELNALITKVIGPIAKLDKLIITQGLPKTRSGKIMRRILRKIAASEFDTLGDISTLLNPEIVEALIERQK
jgi:acetyl-CoA synthetase